MNKQELLLVVSLINDSDLRSKVTANLGDANLSLIDDIIENANSNIPSITKETTVIDGPTT
jgi:hypothetical protein